MPATAEAEGWFEMGAFDQIKKANQGSYQEWIYQTLKLDFARQELSLALRDRELDCAQSFLRLQGRNERRPLVGLNLGGGGRWKKKQWKPRHFATFGRELLARGKADLLLIGGRQEAALLESLRKELPAGVLSTGPDRSLRETAALISCCATIVTGDSLALARAQGFVHLRLQELLDGQLHQRPQPVGLARQHCFEFLHAASKVFPGHGSAFRW